MQNTPQNRIQKFEKYLLIFTLVDILFAPYVFFLATTYSQFIIFFWFLIKDKRFFIRREVKFYYGILGFILLSVFISLLVLPVGKEVEYAIENFKRGLNIGMGISYYFFFFYMFKIVKVRLERWMLAFVLVVTLWGILYYLNVSLFFVLKRIFNTRDATMLNLVNLNYFARYNYIWTDPNNVGYTLVGIVSFLIMNKRVTNIQLIFVVLGLLFNLLIIMSAGSILSAIIFIPTAYIIRLRDSQKFANFAMLVLSFVIMIIIVQNYYADFSKSETGEKSITRLESKSEGDDTRPDIWKELLESKNILFYFFAGEGTVLFVNGKPYSPHNGHLVFIFGYGMVCYFFYMYIVFRKSHRQRWIDYIYILPFLLCFTLNIGVGELKFAAIMYMMVAFSRVYYRNKIMLSQLELLKKFGLLNKRIESKAN